MYKLSEIQIRAPRMFLVNNVLVTVAKGFNLSWWD